MLDEKTVELCKKLKETKYDFTEVDVVNLTYTLMENIGDKDGFIRDGLIYPVLAHLLHDDVLEQTVLKDVTEAFLSDKYLFYDMDNNEEYSVLRRSFTLLQLVILIYKHNQKSLFSETEFVKMVKEFIAYYRTEKDFRGYLPDVGWLHSAAHSADLFSQVVQNEALDHHLIEVILEAIKDRFKQHSYMFVHDEDERSVTVLEKVINRKIISNEFWLEYVRNFARFEKGNLYPEAYHITRNVKCFLRSLYFRIIDNKDMDYLTEEIKRTLENIK